LVEENAMSDPISDPTVSTDTRIGGASGFWDQALNWSLGIPTRAALVAIALAGMLSNSQYGLAQSPNEDEQGLVQIGFRIAPVPLNLNGKDHTLVGLGSFLVNAVGRCDECHTNAQPPNFNYVAGGNPYFGQHPAKIDPTGYLAGGADMGTAISLPSGQYAGPKIVSRNLTPDKTGRPAGGETLAQFMTIMRTGKDYDHQHPTCTSTEPPTPANCIPAPADGEVLQVMPWPRFQYMTDRQLQAIYEYLSAIPCIEGPPDPNPLHNDCH
jgi:hypothetical protein